MRTWNTPERNDEVVADSALLRQPHSQSHELACVPPDAHRLPQRHLAARERLIVPRTVPRLSVDGGDDVDHGAGAALHADRCIEALVHRVVIVKCCNLN